MEEEKITNIHRMAMEYCDLGDKCLREAIAYFQSAYQAELFVANEFKNSDLQPTRSVFYRSAGSIALQCGNIALTRNSKDDQRDEKEKAKWLFLQGLERNPPPEIADEIKELLKECE